MFSGNHKEKSKLGTFFGLGSKKDGSHTLDGKDDSSDTGGDPTVITEDLTQHEDTEHSRSIRTQDFSRTSSVEIAATKTRDKKKSKSMPRRKYSIDAPDGEEEKQMLAARSKDHHANKESSTRSNRSTDNISKESSFRSSRSHPVDVIPEEGEGQESALTLSSAVEGRRQRPRRTAPRQGTKPKFLLQDDAPPKESTDKLQEELQEEPIQSAAIEAQAPPKKLEQTQQDAAYAIISLLSAVRSAHNPKQEKPVDDPKQQNNEAALLGYIEQLVDPAARGEEDLKTVGLEGQTTPTNDIPSTPASPKKAILKVNESETPIQSIATTINPDIQQTIVVPRDFSDEMTCITMDDFEEKITTKPGTGRVKRPGRLKNTLSSSSNPGSVTSGASGLSEAGLAEILRKDIHSKKEPVLLAALDAIAEFASKGSKQRAKVCAFGAIPSILHILEGKKTKPAILISALTALEKVTTKDAQNQVTACELNAIPNISVALQRHLSEKEIVVAACKTLEMITSCMRLASADEAEEDQFEAIPTQGALTVLSCCLITHPKDKDILAYAVGAITNICIYRPHQVQLLSQAGGIVALTGAVKKKWNSKTRKSQAKADLDMIVECET